MPLIEGVGDEVVQFVVVLLVIAVAALAWWSTNAHPDRYRTVLVMRSRPQHPVTVSIRTRPNVVISTSQTDSSTQASTAHVDATANEPEQTERDSRVIPLQEMDSIVDADMAMLDNNRLHFYRRMDAPNQTTAESTSDESETHDDLEVTSNIQMREMDSIVSAMEADVTDRCDFFRNSETNTSASGDTKKPKNETVNKRVTKETSENRNTENTESTSNIEVKDTANNKKILIKLKYLNDTLKEVEGSLDELLQDFKSRHFSAELSSESRVRLIFNGRVLLDDAATLAACGLHDRAVVHCLVHPRRSSQQHITTEENSANTTHEIHAETPAAERAWDLENILMTLVSVALTVVWFFRCEYSNMFTASASVALFGLTVFYSIAIFGLYLSDTFHFERRQERPVPTN